MIHQILLNGRKREDLLVKRLEEVAKRREREAQAAAEKRTRESPESVGGMTRKADKPGLETISQSDTLQDPQPQIPSLDTAVPRTSHLRKTSEGHFLFFNVPYQGGVLPCVERPMDYIDGAQKKSQQEHLDWLADPQNGMTDYTLGDMELEYQLAMISYCLRSEPGEALLAQEYITRMQDLYMHGIVTADRIEYFPGVKAVITNHGKINLGSKKIVKVPLFKSGYFTLSSERPERNLGQVRGISGRVSAFLDDYLGYGFNLAGAFCSYLTPRLDNQNLASTILNTPTTDWRINQRPKVGVCGRWGSGYVISTGIDLMAENRALAVALRNTPFDGGQP